MSFIETRPFRRRGIAITSALYGLVLFAVLSYPPTAQTDQAPYMPLRISLIPNTPIPPTPPIVTKPVPSVEAGPPAGSKSSQPKLKPSAAPGGGRPEIADRSVALLPSDLPVILGGTTLGTGAGDGAGDGQGAGTGMGLAGSGSGSGSGTGGGEPSSELQIAEWIVKPDDKVRRYYPLKAREKRATGWVVLSCLVSDDNRVRDCKILSESPPFLGFAAASLRLSELFRVKPPAVDGRPRYDLRVRIPVTMEHR